LRALLSPRTVFRYVKRLISLPWNFQRFYDNMQTLQEELPQQLEQVRRDLATMLDWHMQRLTWLAEQLGQVRAEFVEALQRQEMQLTEKADVLLKDMRQLRYRFAELYGALAEELRQLGKRQEPLAQERQEHGRAA
jgi:hypothetical protein